MKQPERKLVLIEFFFFFGLHPCTLCLKRKALPKLYQVITFEMSWVLRALMYAAIGQVQKDYFFRIILQKFKRNQN